MSVEKRKEAPILILGKDAVVNLFMDWKMNKDKAERELILVWRESSHIKVSF